MRRLLRANRLRTLVALAAESLMFCAQLCAGAEPTAGVPSALTLDLAERLMELNNREIQSSRRAIDASAADKIVAGQRPNPTLSFQASSVSPSQGIGAGAPWEKYIDQTVHVEQLFERGNKRELRVDQAIRNETASREDLSNSIRQQRLAVRGAYYDLLLSQDKVKLLREVASLAEHSVAAAERRLAAGDISKVDLARIRVDSMRVNNEAMQAEADLSRARIVMAALIGAESHAPAIRAIDSWPAIVRQADIAPDDLAATIEQRPDVQAAKARAEAAESGRRLAQSQRSRDITIGIQYEHYPVNPVFGTGNGNTYGVTVSFPLMVWHENNGEIRRSEVDRLAALDVLAKARAIAHSEIQRAWTDLVQASERVTRYQGKLTEDAKTAAEAVEFAYQHGSIGLTDLLDARRALRAAQLEAVTALGEYAKAVASWKLVLGADPATLSSGSNLPNRKGSVK